MLQFLDESSGKVIGFLASEKLTDDDYEEVFLPALEEVIDEYGSARILLLLEHFEGWTAGGAWEDLKLWPKMKVIERIAVVGEEKWEDITGWISRLFGLLSNMEMKYFNEERITEAWDWLKENAWA